MSKFMLKYQDTEWDLDNPSLTITHEFVSSGIDVVLEHIENFLRSAGYAVDGKLEFVSVDDNEGEVNFTDDDIFGVGSDTIVTTNTDWPYNDNMISSLRDDRLDEITIKVENNNDQPIHFRV
jgi:hypothetical protein